MNGVRCNRERRDLPGCVRFVARLNRRRHCGLTSLTSRVRGVGCAPSRPLLGRSIEIHLHIRSREHDSSDVPAFHHDATLGAKRALTGNEHLAHFRQPRDRRRRLVDLRRPDRPRDVVAVDVDDTALDHESGPLRFNANFIPSMILRHGLMRSSLTVIGCVHCQITRDCR